jgi:predicted DNA-binding WGR domain protein
MATNFRTLRRTSRWQRALLLGDVALVRTWGRLGTQGTSCWRQAER